MLLTVKETAPRLGKSPGWLYHHWRELPFAIGSLGGTPRFSRRGLDEWLRKRQAQRR